MSTEENERHDADSTVAARGLAHAPRTHTARPGDDAEARVLRGLRNGAGLATSATTDRRDADDAQFAAEMDRPDRLEVADEDTVERVARAMASEDHNADCFADEDYHDEEDRDYYRRLAHAAIAELAAPGTDSSGQAVQRVLDLLAPEAGMAASQSGRDRLFAERDIRAAVVGPQRDRNCACPDPAIAARSGHVSQCPSAR